MSRYRILTWSRWQDRLVDLDAMVTGEARGEALIEQLQAAGRAALGLGPRGAGRRQAQIAAASHHVREALRLLDGLASLPSARRLASRLRPGG